MATNFEKLIHDRYSVRKFKSAPIEKDKLDKILEAARIAPTARNSQSQRIKIVDTKSDLALIDECTPYRWGAPLVLIVCYDKSLAWHNKHYPEITASETDAAIAVTQMIYMAWDLGLVSCWVQHFDPIKCAELFKIPKNLVPITLLPIGYASDDCKTSPNHGVRNPLSDFLF